MLFHPNSVRAGEPLCSLYQKKAARPMPGVSISLPVCLLSMLFSGCVQIISTHTQWIPVYGSSMPGREATLCVRATGAFGVRFCQNFLESTEIRLNLSKHLKNF